MTLLNVKHLSAWNNNTIWDNTTLMSSNLVIKTVWDLEKLNDVTDLMAARRRQRQLIPTLSFLTNYYKLFYFRPWLQSHLVLALLGADPSNFFTQFYVFSQTRLVNHSVTKYVNGRLPASPFTLKRLLLTTIRKQWRNTSPSPNWNIDFIPSQTNDFYFLKLQLKYHCPWRIFALFARF